MAILIIGYGNLDRQDDGAAWHVLSRLAKKLGHASPSLEEGLFTVRDGVDMLFDLQLTPEMAEVAARYDRVYFVDAHTGTVPEDYHVEELEPTFQTSPFTHHMTATTCMALCHLYNPATRGVLVSVRGYGFAFSNTLSPQTDRLVDQAVDYLLSQVMPE